MRKTHPYLLAALAIAGLGVGGFAGVPAAAPLVENCATKDGVLGLSRVVEVDTAGGPVFGGSHKGNNFLETGEVVLTFDDGPMRAYTRTVLKALAAHCTKATFFMVGRMAAADPAMVKEVAAAGHTVASHTWSHQNLKPIGFFKARQEFELGISAVTKAAGAPIAPFFRFPFLSDNRAVLEHARKRDVATFFIDVDSKDFQTRDAATVHRRIMNQLATDRKGIILMHDIQPSTAHAIRGLLDDLHAKGYRIVHMVPKGHADTIAEYDSNAEKAIAAKAAAAKEKPLAERSVIWTMANPDEDAAPTPSPAKRPAPVRQPSATASTDATSEGEAFPWQPNKAAPSTSASVTTSSTKTATAKRTPRRQVEELPWQMRIFAQ